MKLAFSTLYKSKRKKVFQNQSESDGNLRTQSLKKPKFSGKLARERAKQYIEYTEYTECKEALVTSYMEFLRAANRVMKSEQCIPILMLVLPDFYSCTESP